MNPSAAIVGTTIILASNSPRRRAFLHALGIDFTTIAADLDESPLAGEAPEALAARLALAKARAVAARLDGTRAVVVAADTVVALNEAILGKPADAAEARAMLTALRGREHRVLTGLCVMDVATGACSLRVNTTRVTMRDYDDDEIAAYVASGDPFDKAGAYAIQHAGFHPVSALDGCISSVMGLPLADLCEMLADYGVVTSIPLEVVCQAQGDYGCCRKGG